MLREITRKTILQILLVVLVCVSIVLFLYLTSKDDKKIANAEGEENSLINTQPKKSDNSLDDSTTTLSSSTTQKKLTTATLSSTTLPPNTKESTSTALVSTSTTQKITTTISATSATAAPSSNTTSVSVASTAAASGPSAEAWAALRKCESGGNYQIISSNGLYHGAYQFNIATWNGVARSAGRDDLTLVKPNEASEADQDAMALKLYEQRGKNPWPHCGKHL